MARSSDIGSQLGQLVGIGAFAWFFTVGISDYFHISRLLAFAILVGIFLSLFGIGRAVVSQYRLLSNGINDVRTE